jgi:hypothetical protein
MGLNVNRKEHKQLISINTKIDSIETKLDEINTNLKKSNRINTLQLWLTYLSISIAYIALGFTIPTSLWVYGFILKIIGVCFIFYGTYLGMQFFIKRK